MRPPKLPIELIVANDHHGVKAASNEPRSAFIWSVGVVEHEDKEAVVLMSGGAYFDTSDGIEHTDQFDTTRILKSDIVLRMKLGWPKPRDSKSKKRKGKK